MSGQPCHTGHSSQCYQLHFGGSVASQDCVMTRKRITSPPADHGLVNLLLPVGRPYAIAVAVILVVLVLVTVILLFLVRILLTVIGRACRRRPASGIDTSTSA